MAAQKTEAEEIIVAHNHPSGDPAPGKADRDATARLRAGASLVGLKLVDHIVIGAENSANQPGFFSFAEFASA